MDQLFASLAVHPYERPLRTHPTSRHIHERAAERNGKVCRKHGLNRIVVWLDHRDWIAQDPQTGEIEADRPEPSRRRVTRWPLSTYSAWLAPCMSIRRSPLARSSTAIGAFVICPAAGILPPREASMVKSTPLAPVRQRDADDLLVPGPASSGVSAHRRAGLARSSTLVSCLTWRTRSCRGPPSSLRGEHRSLCIWSLPHRRPLIRS